MLFIYIYTHSIMEMLTEEELNEFVNVIKMETNINEKVSMCRKCKCTRKTLICITCQYPKVLLIQHANSKNARHVQH